MSRARLDVAAGVLRRGDEVLLAERLRGGHGVGYWEFPGGKIEPGETPRAALIRELAEEIDVVVVRVAPLVTVCHDYPARRVRLHVFEVSEWRGEPRGREGQGLLWCAVHQLGGVRLLEANAPVVDALAAAESG